MSIQSQTSLTNSSQAIKNETAIGANTATRVGTVFEDIVDTMFDAKEFTKTITLDRTDLLALNGTPIEVIPSSTSKIHCVRRILVKYTYDTSQVALGTLSLYYSTVTGTPAASFTVDAFTSNKVIYDRGLPITSINTSAISDSIYLTASSATPSGGSTNTAVTLIIHYTTTTI